MEEKANTYEQFQNDLKALKEIAEYTLRHEEYTPRSEFDNCKVYYDGVNNAKHKVNEILFKYCII